MVRIDSSRADVASLAFWWREWGTESMSQRNFTPRYFEIEQALRQRIEAAQPGDPLPSETELCEEFGVSRMTARAAMKELVREGLVRREPGRGSFVAQQLVHRHLSQLMSFSDEMRRRGMTPSSKVIDSGVRPASDLEARALEIPVGSEVVFLHRVRLADNTPMAVEFSVLQEKCSPILDEDLARGSLHAALGKLGFPPVSGRSSVTAAAIAGQDAKLLQLPRHTPMLIERRIISDDAGKPLEYTESRYVSERYRLEVEFVVAHPSIGE
ncbi:GntR family transcriptional regulator [Nonomuraea sp. NPDC026600]|uniref:GntR family transcriptional regulator n=1 Tax=Nonomuraea sp. NPDC026600 TaxID=3155363 RepID=UPI0033F37635